MEKKINKKEKKKGDKKRVVLLDAHAILHRAYHALPDFTSSKGEATGGLYGLVTMLLKIVDELKPDYIIACFDLPEPTYRHEIYEAYKAGRSKADEELISQIIRSRDVFEAFNIPIYEKVRFEADDVLGAIAEQTKKDKSLEIVIASGDMDTLQLVDGKRVQVYTLKKGISDTIMYDEKAVKKRFGFPPKLLPDYKGLRGDPSDNIVGIAGIGEKTATTLIENFGTIESIYKALKKDKDKLLDAGIKPRIIGLLEEGEEEALFSKELATIRRDVPITFKLPDVSWRESVEVEQILNLFEELSFRTLSDRIKKFFAVVDEVEEEKPKEEIDEGRLGEASVALWLVRSNMTNPSLDEVLQFGGTGFFKDAEKKIFEELKTEKLEKVFNEIEKPIIPIVAEMKDVGILIDKEYLEKLSKEYHKELSKLERAIYKEAGEEFNINSPKQLSGVLYEKLGLTPKNQKKTSTGQKSTKESELEKLRDEHEIIEKILSYRELQKLLSTYIDNIPHMVGSDGRLHAEFIQSGTTTGRMSSANPNLQNIPIKTELGRRIRNAFVAGDGFEMVAFDYSQIELRLAAFLSGDEKLLGVFKSGGDVHTAVASEVFAVPPEMVDKEMRRQAKVINFGIIYGMGVNALRQNLGGDVKRADAQKFYNDYFKNFSGLAHYLDKVKASAARLGYTETYFGRKRHFEGINSSIPFVRASAERMAINAPIQGTEADIIKIAMIRVNEYLEKENLKGDARLLLQVHDELVYEIKKEKVKEISLKIKEIMEGALPASKTNGLTFVADVSSGENWGQMSRLDI